MADPILAEFVPTSDVRGLLGDGGMPGEIVIESPRKPRRSSSGNPRKRRGRIARYASRGRKAGRRAYRGAKRRAKGALGAARAYGGKIRLGRMLILFGAGVALGVGVEKGLQALGVQSDCLRLLMVVIPGAFMIWYGGAWKIVGIGLLVGGASKVLFMEVPKLLPGSAT